jgi:lipoprotein-releasing system permease protein
MDELPVHYDPVHFISMVVTTVGVSFLASLVPAWMAARMDPVEALRHD